MARTKRTPRNDPQPPQLPSTRSEPKRIAFVNLDEGDAILPRIVRRKVAFVDLDKESDPDTLSDSSSTTITEDSHKAGSSSSQGKGKCKGKGKGKGKAKTLVDEDTGIECEICCTEDVPLAKLVQCQEGHLFCMDCARTMAETQIGMQKCALPCMSMEGCEAVFDEREVKRFMKPKTYSFWQRLRQQEDIESAKIDGLQTCPFCDYAYIIEDPEERLFECRSEKCKRFSCRLCKRENHLPKTCEEVTEDAESEKIHKAEEEMTAAILRRCPNKACKTPMIKDETSRSCNKMFCSKCGAMMCYVCRADVSKVGYAHFEDRPEKYATSTKCPLWDDTASRHQKEIDELRQKLGKNAPKLTAAEEADHKRRKERFDRQYGRDAPRVPNAWGFEDPRAHHHHFHHHYHLMDDPFHRRMEEMWRAAADRARAQRPAAEAAAAVRPVAVRQAALQMAEHVANVPRAPINIVRRQLDPAAARAVAGLPADDEGDEDGEPTDRHLLEYHRQLAIRPMRDEDELVGQFLEIFDVADYDRGMEEFEELAGYFQARAQRLVARAGGVFENARWMQIEDIAYMAAQEEEEIELDYMYGLHDDDFDDDFDNDFDDDFDDEHLEFGAVERLIGFEEVRERQARLIGDLWVPLGADPPPARRPDPPAAPAAAAVPRRGAAVLPQHVEPRPILAPGEQLLPNMFFHERNRGQVAMALGGIEAMRRVDQIFPAGRALDEGIAVAAIERFRRANPQHYNKVGVPRAPHVLPPRPPALIPAPGVRHRGRAGARALPKAKDNGLKKGTVAFVDLTESDGAGPSKAKGKSDTKQSAKRGWADDLSYDDGDSAPMQKKKGRDAKSAVAAKPSTSRQSSTPVASSSSKKMEVVTVDLTSTPDKPPKTLRRSTRRSPTPAMASGSGKGKSAVRG